MADTMTPEQIAATGLKPCPFCGGEWVIFHEPANGSPVRFSCKGCNAWGPFHAGNSKDQAAAAWNTRTTSEWQDIATAPKDGATFVLLWDDDRAGAVTGLWRFAWALPDFGERTGWDRSLDTKDGYWVEDVYRDDMELTYPYRPIHTPTHWMPLPPLPRETHKP